MVSVFNVFILFTPHFSNRHTETPQVILPFLIQMAMWSFRDALEELELRRQFDDSMLKSEVGLRLGDVRFAELQTTIKMRAV